MSHSVQTLRDDLLQIRSFMSDATSFGLVSRPRLWWASHTQPPQDQVRAPVNRGRHGALQKVEQELGTFAEQFEVSYRQVAATCRVGRFSNGTVRFPCRATRPPPKRK